jgi:hypothetical protein
VFTLKILAQQWLIGLVPFAVFHFCSSRSCDEFPVCGHIGEIVLLTIAAFIANGLRLRKKVIQRHDEEIKKRGEIKQPWDRE